jgi:hypothetical protein
MQSPDHYIEEFWLNFKQSMNNFYGDSKHNYDKMLNSPLKLYRPIIQWSNKLNELQKNQDYDLIEINIRDFISLYAIDVLRTLSNYHMNILITNIKRWNAISNKIGKFEICEVKYINVVFLLIDLYNTLTKCIIEDNELLDLFSIVELYIINEDFKPFIDYAIKHKKPSIIDKINEYEIQHNRPTYNKYIESKYKIELSPKMSAKKIFLKLE